MSTAQIPLNSLSRHISPFQEELASLAAQVVKSGHFVIGPHLARFEQAFAQYCGVSDCVGVANGTDALELGLKSLGITHQDKVAVVANAAMYGTSAVLACGATPVFIDVQEATANMDSEALQAAFLSNPTIKVVIATHLYGRLANIDAICKIANQHGASVLEDCAQAHGASLPGSRRAGSFGDAACFSFYPTKNLGALGDGGAVVTNNSDIARKIRQLRQYGWSQKYENQLAGGRNSRLDEIQAAFLMFLLPFLDGWNEKRRQISVKLSAGINHADIQVPDVGEPDYVAHLYVVQTPRRDALREHLARHGIQTDIHYPLPDHLQPCHQGKFSSLSLPVTEKLSQTSLTLPCFPELTDHEVQNVIDACNRF